MTESLEDIRRQAHELMLKAEARRALERERAARREMIKAWFVMMFIFLGLAALILAVCLGLFILFGSSTP